MTARIFYTYIHKKKGTEDIFYVGKGSKNRCYTSSGHSLEWAKIVLEFDYDVEIIKNALTEEEAFKEEIALIAKCKNEGHDLCNLTDGGKAPEWAIASRFRSKKNKEPQKHQNRPRKTPMPKTPLASVALWFRNKRESVDMTQSKFSAHVGIPIALISDLERGSIDVRLSSVLLALDILGGELTVKDCPKIYDIESVFKEDC